MMTSKEAKTHIIDTLNGDMNKEYFINELLPEILKDLDRLEKLEKAQELEIKNLKFNDTENKYQVAIRVLKEAFIVLGKSDIANTCWFKYLEELEKENQELKRKYESHDFLYQNEVSKNGTLAGKIFEKDLKIQKLKEVIKFLGEQLDLDVDLENHNLITEEGTIGFVNADSETMSILELLKEVLEE